MAHQALKSVITTKASLASIVLVTNALVWYFFAFGILNNIAETMAFDQLTTLILWGLHFSSAIFSALIGGVLINKREHRSTFLISWMLIGVVSSLVPLAVNITDPAGGLLFASLSGVAFGIGIPTCMGYYSDCTSVESRGRLGGIIICTNGLGMLLLGTFAESIPSQSIVLAVWRMIGLGIFLLIRPQKEINEEKRISYRSVLAQRPVILYLVPWILFSLVNYLSLPVLSNILDSSIIEFSFMVENVIAAVFAIIGGFFMDFVGRKRMATAGFVLLGIGYTILGIAPGNILGLYFYMIVDGVAWGTLSVLFILTIWGDLSYGGLSDKFYAIAVPPFLFSLFLRYAIGPYVSDVSPYAIFSFTAFFLFLAVLPLMYAPETLPEKTMKDRELKKYVEKAQKEAAKAQGKEAENAPRENGDTEAEFEVNHEDYEEALKQAEKYY